MRLWFLILFTAAAVWAQDHSTGKKLYEAHCALCHGQTAEGGRGPNLTLPRLKHVTGRESLVAVIQNGVPATEMPNAWQLTANEVGQMADYLLSLGRTAKVDLPGDAANGKALFAGKSGCAACHIVSSQGRAMGPELTWIGARRSPEYLRKAIVDPAAASPEGYMVIEATTASGQTIRGGRVNEDSFTIQIRDAAGKYHSLRKANIKLAKLSGQSTMPSYEGKLTPSELDDIVAYLAGLRGDL